MLELQFIFLHFHGPTNSCYDNWFYFFLRTGNIYHISSEIPNLATEDTVSVLPISIQVRTDCWGQLVKRSIEWINNAMTMLQSLRCRWRVNVAGKVTCASCSRSCKDQAVKVGDKYFHVDCFVCKGRCLTIDFNDIAFQSSFCWCRTK